MEPGTFGWVRETTAILGKDLTSEFRSRVAMNSIFLFALTTLILVSFVVGPYRVRSADKPLILSAWLWIILFFSGMSGLARVFVKEEETSTAPALKLAAKPEAVFLGKYLFNLILMSAVTTVITPLYVILMEFQVRAWYHLVLVLIFGVLGLTTGVTILAAMVSSARMRGTLFSILSFPVILPILLVAIDATGGAAGAGPPGELWRSLAILAAFSGAMFLMSLMLFERIWIE